MQSNNVQQDTVLSNYDSFLTQQEEDERQRRLQDKEEAIARKVNAQGLANLIKESSFTNGGSAHSEEVERERRLQDRDEAVARKVNAHELANLVKANGGSAHSEEVERERRIQDRDEAVLRKVNAQEAANLISSLHSGSAHNEERERERRLQNRDEAVARKVLAHEVSSLIKEEEPLVDHAHTRQLEEAERQRRLDDRDESVSRKVNGQNVSDSIRREAATIKARFVKRPSLWKMAKTSNLGKVLYNTISTAPAVASKLVHDTAAAGDNAMSNAMPVAYENAKSMMSTAASFLPSLATIKNTANNIKDTVMNNIPFVTPQFATLAEVKAAEELERQRRMAEDKDSCAIGNARKVSQLLNWSYPNRNLHKTYPSGFHKHTNSWEERERTRRLANKSEMETHRLLSSRLANIVNQVGWPFIQNAKGVLPLNNSAKLAEEERMRVLADQKGMLTSRFNANKVANLVGDAFKPNDHATMHRFTRSLEEKERRHRMKSPDAAVHGAHRHAALIKNIGAPFYKPTSTIADEIGKLDYQKARSVPLPTLEPRKAKKMTVAPLQQVEAKEIRRGSLLSSLGVAQEVVQEKPREINTSWMEEGERKSRMHDKTLQHLAMDNAHKVSGMIKKKQGPYKQRSVSFKPEVTEYPCPVYAPSPASAPLNPLHATHSSNPFLPTLQHAQGPQTAAPLQQLPQLEKKAPLAPQQQQPILAPAHQERSMPDQTLPLHAAQMAKAPAPDALNYVNPFVPATATAAPAPAPIAVAPAPAHLSVAPPAPTNSKGSPYPERSQPTPLYEEPYKNEAPHKYVPAMSKAAAPSSKPHTAPAKALSQWSFDKAAVAPAPTPAPVAAAAPLARPQTVVAPTTAPVPAFIAPQQVAPAYPVSHAPHQPQQQLYQQPAPVPVLKPVSHTVTPTPAPVSGPVSTYRPTTTTASLPHHTSAPLAQVPLRSAPLAQPATSFAAPLPSSQQRSVLPATHQHHQPTVTPLAEDTYYMPDNQPIVITTTTTIPNAAKPSRFGGQPDNKLVQSVMKLYEAETAQAEREKHKAESLAQKKSAFSRFRKQRHESAAHKHAANAQRHHDWLLGANPAMSAL